VAEKQAQTQTQTQALAQEPERLALNIDGWEGPLDLLLDLARRQKVDLKAISILELVDQFIAYIAHSRLLRLEIAADYLVMAAWLAYLKSCILLPSPPDIDPSPEEMALRLQLRLERLQAMRDMGAQLFARDLLGRDIFPRGAPEGLHIVRTSVWQARLFDLLAAYGAIAKRNQPVFHVVHSRNVLTLDEALHRISSMLGMAVEWTDLRRFLVTYEDAELQRSALASSFLASLELARLGKIDIQQEAAFAPLYVRSL
jgi:segregation and condensation protein A